MLETFCLDCGGRIVCCDVERLGTYIEWCLDIIVHVLGGDDVVNIVYDAAEVLKKCDICFRN